MQHACVLVRRSRCRSGLLPWRRSISSEIRGIRRCPWGLVNIQRGADGVSPSAGVRGCRFSVVALATVAGLIGGGGAVLSGCLMQAEGVHTYTRAKHLNQQNANQTRLRTRSLSVSLWSDSTEKIRLTDAVNPSHYTPHHTRALWAWLITV